MREDFLHFVWQYQAFDTNHLVTSSGEPLHIHHRGITNLNEGADFQMAKMTIGTVLWVGSVEIHLRSSDWQRHQHSQNLQYNNVILHVVWQNDAPCLRPDGSPMPTLALEGLVDLNLLQQYQGLMQSQAPIPCATQLPKVAPLIRTMTLDRALVQRMELKAQRIAQYQTNQDWEQSAYQALARALGAKVNAEPFEALSRQVPLKILHKHRDQLLALEAILMGVAGLLPQEPTDSYSQQLVEEYRFLAHKYDLAPQQLPTEMWQYSRLRPGSFPPLRVAQLAALIHQEPHWFSTFLRMPAKALLQYLQIKPSEYWQRHYQFAKKQERPSGKLGKSTAQQIVINAAAPLLMWYAQLQANPDYAEKAVDLLESLPPEDNHRLRMWYDLGWEAKNAHDSQALLGLYEGFCAPKQCLRCSIGTALLKNKPDS
ncbi:DUF2851 family protein [Eisenibacter elegans]|uniref:DUF2851 family protein n=1 Tax=Eisenibacter elegans TaxID=997 RepID=UPI00041E4E3C|nr:DUF2851 family protein [Eisenibacter elegans]